MSAAIVSAILTIPAAIVLGACIMSAAPDRLTASIDTLSAAVDNAVAKITAQPGSEDTAINAAADRVDTLTAALNNAQPSAQG